VLQEPDAWTLVAVPSDAPAPVPAAGAFHGARAVN
jgi:hypothetical protein